MRIRPWRRASRPGHPSDGLAEARAARAEAEETSRQVRAQWAEVHEVSAALRRHLARNHFGEMVRDALRGER